MYHSIYIETEKNGIINTFATFHLISESRPIINPPEVKTTYVDIPGADGSLDYTEALNGLHYQNRKGSWEFYVLNEQYGNDTTAWSVHYSNILNLIHGQKFKKIYLEDETDKDGFPKYYYVGRLSVNEWRSDPQFSKIVIDYDLESRKYQLPKEGQYEWQWDDLFDTENVNPIQYGRFTVTTTKMRNFVNGTNEVIQATVYCQTAMKFIKGGNVINMAVGNNTLDLQPGDNIYRIEGNGNVTVYYDNGGSRL